LAAEEQIHPKPRAKNPAGGTRCSGEVPEKLVEAQVRGDARKRDGHDADQFFIFGLLFILSISFVYFFRADRSILRRMMPTINNPQEYITHLNPLYAEYDEGSLVRTEWYFESPRKLRRTRNVSHYTRQFIDSIFKRHHFAAIIAVFIAFVVLIITGFFLEYSFFQIPAAASITIFFSILIGVAGAFAYFLQSWSIPYLIILLLILNLFYKLEWIDPRNKAYGLNYANKDHRPSYTHEGLLSLCSK
jgi:hypothetical protein